jgi:hypothetical protein
MNKLFFLLFFFPGLALSQSDNKEVKFPMDSSTGKITFIEVVNVDSATADQLYSRAKLFVADSYKSNKAVTQLNDDAAKTVLIKPIIINHAKGFGEYGYTSYQFTIQCKDNKYRYIITDFYHHGREYAMNKMKDGGPLEQDEARGNNKKTWQQIKQEDFDDINNLIAELKKAMTSKSNSDW